MKAMGSIFIFILSFNIFASSARLKVQFPQFLKLREDFNLRVYLEEDGQPVAEVSSDVRFNHFKVKRKYGNTFYFPIERNPVGLYVYDTIYVYYSHPDTGEQLSTTARVSASTRPDYLNITGPFTVRTGSYSTYRVYGTFSGYREDLTDMGRWYANYGYINSFGSYRAPNQEVYDRIQFSYGQATDSFSIQVRE